MSNTEAIKEESAFIEIAGNYIRKDQILIGDFSEYKAGQAARCAKIVVDLKSDPYRLFNEAADEAKAYFEGRVAKANA